jgi:hypothetical protein
MSDHFWAVISNRSGFLEWRSSTKHPGKDDFLTRGYPEEDIPARRQPARIGLLAVSVLDKRREERQNSRKLLRRFGSMLRRMMIPAVLFLCAFPLRAQVEARQATPEEVKKTAPATQTEVPSPMLLEVPLAGNGTPAKPHVVDLPKDRTRVIKDTAAYVCDQMTVQSVSIRKRPAKKGRIELVVVPTLRTEYYRQKVDVAVALMNGEREIRSWKISSSWA